MANPGSEPECIRKWACEFEARIRSKDASEREKMVSMEEQGMKVNSPTALSLKSSSECHFSYCGFFLIN